MRKERNSTTISLRKLHRKLMAQRQNARKKKLKLKRRDNGKNIENPLLVFIMCVVLIFALAT